VNLVSFEFVFIDKSARSLIVSISTYSHNQNIYLLRQNRNHKRDKLVHIDEDNLYTKTKNNYYKELT
jgi:hypothetical protein